MPDALSSDAMTAPGGRSRGPRLLVAVGGLVASGKSSIAREVARALGAVHVEADAVRDELLEIEPGQLAHEAAWSDNLAPGVTDRVYAEVLARAARALEGAETAVVDGCFARRAQREAARAVARAADADFLFVDCMATRGVLESRLRARSREAGIAPGAWFALLDRVEARWEPVAELAAAEYLRVDSDRALAPIVGDVLAATAGEQTAKAGAR